MLWLSIGIGLLISLLFAEFLGLAAGGLVVPGYVALFWNRPLQIVGTVLAALVVVALIRLISNYALVYGRRRLVLTILLGFLIGSAIRGLGTTGAIPALMPLDPIGYIIPGLLAYWMERQGVVETISTLVIASILARMILILILGGAPIEITWF